MDKQKAIITEKLSRVKELITLEYFNMVEADDDLKVKYYLLINQLIELKESEVV
tara:strand:- start:795 stop:956 length:162 start_codon:yes stop_codon:yes gene_type:complete